MKNYKTKLKSIYIEITNKCNFRCMSCYNSSSAENNLFLDYKTVERIIHECKELSGEIIYLSGGEPLLHANVWDMLDCCVKNGVAPFVVTNGSLLDEKNIIKLMKTCASLQISLDGYNKQTNDMVRGQGSFEKVTKALSLLKEYNYSSKVRVRCTLNKINSDDLQAYVDLAKIYQVAELSFGWMAPLGRGNSCFEYAGIAENDYYEIYQKVNLLRKQCESEDLEIGQMELINCCPMLSDEHLPIELNIRITPKGDVCLCQRISVESEVIGNINNNSLDMILSSDRIYNLFDRLFLRKTMVTDKCKHCFIRTICNRGCPGLSFQKGSENEFDDFCMPRKQLCASALFDRK